MPIEVIYHQIKPFFKRITQVVVVVLTLFAIVSLFQFFVKPDRLRMAQNAQHAEERMLAHLHEALYDNYQNKTDDEKSVSDFLTYSMCNLSGAMCTDELQTKRDKNGIGMQLGSLVGLPLSHPPASGVFTVINMFENAGFIPKTYAQGIGFASLASFQNIWKALRDVVFLLLVIAIVITGFMVMFNIPGGGKASVAIESILPRLVITLIAISLSYAIAGLLVDLMYVLTFLVVTIFDPILPGEQVAILSSVTSGSPTNLFSMMFSNSWGTLFQASQALYAIIPDTFRYVIDQLLFYLLGTGILTFIKKAPKAASTDGAAKGFLKKMWGGAAARVTGAEAKASSGWGKGLSILLNPGFNPLFSKIVGTFSGADKTARLIGDESGNFAILGNNVVQIIIGVIRILFIEPILALFRSFLTVVIIFILVLGAFLLSIFKLFWLLFSTYVSIILMIIFAPVYILLNALPGNNSLVAWIKQLSILLLTYPLTLALFLVALFFIQSPELNEMWAPPFVSGLVPSQQAVQALIAGTLLFSIPTLIDKVRETLGFKKGFSLSPVAMISPWIGLVGGTMGSLTAAGAFKQQVLKGGLLGSKLQQKAGG